MRVKLILDRIMIGQLTVVCIHLLPPAPPPPPVPVPLVQFLQRVQSYTYFFLNTVRPLDTFFSPTYLVLVSCDL